MFKKSWENVRNKCALVHSLTNYVTVNDCANIILACGGSPIMADDIKEVEDITSICDSLVINIGTLNERTVESMILAGKKANTLGHPVILDPVGAGASKLRTETVFRLLKEIKFSVIRGNISEIKAVSQGNGTTKGVDADVADKVGEHNLDEVIGFAKLLSRKTDAIIAITGEIDIVADEKKAYIIRNGHPLMSKITGTGCMLTTVIGSYCGSNPANNLEATAAAVCLMGISGEIAFKKLKEQNAGTSTYKTLLIDAVSIMDIETLEGEAKVEIR